MGWRLAHALQTCCGRRHKISVSQSNDSHSKIAGRAQVEEHLKGCFLCGNAESPLLMNESWAGTFHSACYHGACLECLRKWVQAELPRCRAEGQLRVCCYAPGCTKFMPQALVFHVSSAARGLSLEIDYENDCLPACYEQLLIDWEPRACAICNDYVGPTLKCKACSYGACEMCVGRWVDVQLPKCYAQRRLTARCFNPACEEPIECKVAIHTSAPAHDLIRALRRRTRLQQNKLYPAAVQVDCPKADCVGLGYLGFDTVMCFICEHQWSIADACAPSEELPGALKACPRCHSQIEKNGGCDHMTCLCGYEFFWTTLLPYRKPE